MVTRAVMNAWSDAEIAARLDDGESSRARLAAIDVHAHYLPPAYRRALADAGITHPDGYHAGVPAWDVDAQLAHMDRLGIATAVCSISTPGVLLSGVDPVRVAREANEAGAELHRDHPGKLGFYAALPVPDVDSALAEIDYAFDELGAWGVSLLTHTEGVYLGDQRLQPVFDELGRRGAVVLVHPTEPAQLVPGVMSGWSRSMYEFFFDSTRAVINLIFSGQLERNPGIRLIIPHAGAALPALAQRLERNVWRANREPGADPYPSVLDTLTRCYFDLAGSVLPHQLASLQMLAHPDRIVYGSDFPYTNTQMGAELNADLRSTALLSIEDKKKMLRNNALSLFPAATAGGAR